MIGNLLLGLALACFIGAAAVPESKSQPAGGVLHRISAFFTSARPMIAIPMIGYILGVFIESAIAQTPGATPPSWRSDLMAVGADFMIQSLQILGPPALAWLGWQVTRLLGLKQEAERRDALQQALQNAAGKMVQAAGSAIRTAAIGTVDRNKALKEGLDYLRQAAPGAIAYFKLTEDDLIEKLEAKAGLLIADSMESPRK